jgi:hypothetical protein
MRELPAATQEERRRQVIGLRQARMTYAAIAGQVGLSRTGVIDICQRLDFPDLHGNRGKFLGAAVAPVGAT